MTFSRKPILLIQGPGHSMERETVGQACQSVGGSKRGGAKGEPISDLAEIIIKPPPPKMICAQFDALVWQSQKVEAGAGAKPEPEPDSWGYNIYIYNIASPGSQIADYTYIYMYRRIAR